MNLSMTGALAADYHSGAQRARVVTEAWGEKNLFCPNCPSPNLSRQRDNTRVIDFICPTCNFRYHLKGQKTRLGASITDGAYEPTVNAFRNDVAPDFYFMHYDLATWRVKNLLLVPHFAFPPSAIIKRPPLSPTARRAGWIGCNFALNRIPSSARILVVSEGTISQPAEVRERYRLVRKQVEGLTVKQRGWRLDVLRVIQSLGKSEFTTTDAYIFERELEQLHPDNRNIKAKIRQQLQELRDRNLLLHLDRNRWRLP